jgi:signal peptidase II
MRRITVCGEGLVKDAREMRTAEVPKEAFTAAGRLDRRWLVGLPLMIIVLDQILKAIFTSWLGSGADNHRWELVGSALAFEYLENRGAAFGILPEQTGLLTILSILIAGFGITLMWREAKAHPLTAVAIGMVVGGAIGNIVDRVRLGYVVDFVAVGTWPKFNLADSMITIGVLMLIWSSIRDERRAHSGNREEDIDGR